jgi:hypothetical protein
MQLRQQQLHTHASSVLPQTNVLIMQIVQQQLHTHTHIHTHLLCPPADQRADHADCAAADARAGHHDGRPGTGAGHGIHAVPGGAGQSAPPSCTQAQAATQGV